MAVARRKHDRLIYRLLLAGMLINAVLSGMAINALWKFSNFISAASDQIEEKKGHDFAL